MHTIKPLKEQVREIQKGLAQMSRHRIMALPSHTTWELIDDLEERARLLMRQLDELESKPPPAKPTTQSPEQGLH